MTGTIFDIRELTLHDGSGVRVTVFMKGCPLRCEWCQNPEGLRSEPQLLYRVSRCTHCGLCKRGCSHKDCKPYGRCLHICPNDCLVVCGEKIQSAALAARLKKYFPILEACRGGVTFSGGEPLLQADFVIETISHMRRMGFCGEVAIETCGYAAPETFRALAGACDAVIMDIKLFDAELHKKYTGADNEIIKQNFLWLRGSGIPYLIRTPMIKGITDTKENISAIRAFIGDSRWEQIPENNLAKAKYSQLVDL